MNKMFVSAIGCVVGLLTGCSREEKPAAPATPPGATEASPALVVIPPDSPMLRQIRVEPVQTADLPTAEVIVRGKIEVNPNRVSHVVMPVAGRVASVLVKLGDAVTENQPLLAIQSPDANAAMASYPQTEASVTQAKAALVKAQADFDRFNDLYEHKAVAKKDVLDANNTLTQTKAALEQVQTAREQAVRRLGLLGLKPGASRSNECLIPATKKRKIPAFGTPSQQTVLKKLIREPHVCCLFAGISVAHHYRLRC